MDALALRVRLRRSEIDLGVDAEEIELRIRSHLVDDLRHGRAMLAGRGEFAAAEVLRDDVRRQLALGLTLGEALEAAVDDGDLDALSGEALRVPGGRERGRDLLPAQGVLESANGVRTRSTVDRRESLSVLGASTACTRFPNVRSTRPPSPGRSLARERGPGSR